MVVRSRKAFQVSELIVEQYSNRKTEPENNQAKTKSKYTFTSVCLSVCVCVCAGEWVGGWVWVCVHIQNIYTFRILSNLLNLCCGQAIDLSHTLSQ